jgi:hypothetical protein
MTEREALKLALEALEILGWQPTEEAMDYRDNAIAAIKEALAGAEGERQPEQEPVGQLLEDAFGRGQVMWFNKPKDESMLYTTSPQRTWVGLTDEEIDQGLLRSDYALQTAHAWRAGVVFAMTQLKEKNT